MFKPRSLLFVFWYFGSFASFVNVGFVCRKYYAVWQSLCIFVADFIHIFVILSSILFSGEYSVRPNISPNILHISQIWGRKTFGWVVWLYALRPTVSTCNRIAYRLSGSAIYTTIYIIFIGLWRCHAKRVAYVDGRTDGRVGTGNPAAERREGL